MIELNEQLEVQDLDDKVRLDVFLANETGWTRSQIKLQIDAKKVLVNGKAQKAGFLIKNGDMVQISFSKEVLDINAEAEDIPLDIVYEDDDYAIINKPQGMVVHPAPGAYNHTLVNALLFYFDNLSSGSEDIRPGIVHRIDKDTSGLLVVAKNDKAHASLAGQIAEHTCFRHYLALLEGNLKQDQGTVETYIARNPNDRKKMCVISKNSKEAVTHYSVINEYKGYTHIRCRLETGRTHQIRVHMAHLGHPVAGDLLYGVKNEKVDFIGQCLHARKIGFIHPRSNEYLEFSSALPDYFECFLRKLNNISK